MSTRLSIGRINRPNALGASQETIVNTTRALQVIEFHLRRAKEFVVLQGREKNYHKRKSFGDEANYHSRKANVVIDVLNGYCEQTAVKA
jgi:hypothetical protein